MTPSEIPTQNPDGANNPGSPLERQNRNFAVKALDQAYEAAKATVRAAYVSTKLLVKSVVKVIISVPGCLEFLAIGLIIFLIVWGIIGVISKIKGSSPLQQADSSKPADVAQVYSLGQNVGADNIKAALSKKATVKKYIGVLQDYITKNDGDKASADADKKKLYESAVELKDKLNVLIDPVTSTQDKAALQSRLFELIKYVQSILGAAI